MIAPLATLLLEAGLLQFGRFQEDGAIKPYRLSLDLLPSYPDVLAYLADLAQPLLGEIDHLLSAPDALPFGLSLSLKSRLPLVYARGTQAAAVHELAGAYDIGHPALLVGNTMSPALLELSEQANVVGLETQRILVIIDEGQTLNSPISVLSLLNLKQTVGQLEQSGKLARGQAQLVQHWIDANRHPGSAAP
jgi:hypothetical protein